MAISTRRHKREEIPVFERLSRQRSQRRPGVSVNALSAGDRAL
jgi:hypothetical protein